MGKTCFVQRLTENAVADTHTPTIGIDFATNIRALSNGNIAKIQLWDTAGQEVFAPIVRSYYRGVAGAIVMFDLSRYQTFAKLRHWLHDLHVNRDSEAPIPVSIIGNKSDTVGWRVSEREARKFAQEQQAQYHEISATTGINVHTAFQTLVEAIYQNMESGHKIGTTDNRLVRLTKASRSKSKCCRTS